MREESAPSWRPEGEPLTAFEKFLLRAADDSSRHGEMFRRLMATELCLLVPREGMEEGEHTMTADEPLPFCLFSDGQETFTPVFTSPKVAEACAARLPQDIERVIAEMDAPTLFRLVNTGETVVRLMGPEGIQISLQPEAVNGLLTGTLTDARPPHDAPERHTLHEVNPASLPPALVEGIRNFCDKRRVPLGVYAFVTTDPASGEIRHDRLHLMLRLRDEDNPFYNDFGLMAQQSAKELKILLGVVTPDNGEALEFLARCRPLWPVMDD